MKKKGFFIAVDGCDAAGKSSAMSYMKDFFVNKKGYKESDVITVREPGGTYIGETIRSLLLDPDEKKDKMDIRTETMLMYASRNQLLKEVIEPALKKGQVVISDRWESSTFTYQKVRGADPKDIKALSDFTCTTQPDMMMILDVTPEKTLERIANKREGFVDRMESNEASYYSDIRNTYLEYAKEKNSMVINASVDLQEMLNDIKEKLEENTKDLKKKKYPSPSLG